MTALFSWYVGIVVCMKYFFLSYFCYVDGGETCVSPKFVTRHLASCKLSHLDPESMPYLGYLPHDILGKTILDFYHPEDLPFLKEAYQIGKVY
jgi:period circadian protein